MITNTITCYIIFRDLIRKKDSKNNYFVFLGVFQKEKIAKNNTCLFKLQTVSVEQLYNNVLIKFGSVIKKIKNTTVIIKNVLDSNFNNTITSKIKQISTKINRDYFQSAFFIEASFR